jgi:methylthioribose-1-phosphate isomerase
MNTGSTASSGTEGPDPQDPQEAAEAPAGAEGQPTEPEHDPARRAFFFQFGKQAATAAAQVAGMADVVGRTSSAMAGELLGLDDSGSTAERPPFERSGVATDPVVSAAEPAGEDSHRSAYRLAGDELVMLDQRRIPEALDEVVAVRGSDVAYYLRLGVARGGPLMAQLAAYGLALTASERIDGPAEARDLELRRTRRALVEARASSRLLAWSTERMQGAISGLGPSSPGAEVATTMRDEADAIARDITTWEAAVAARLVEQLPQPGGRPLTVLLHGDHGPLSTGQLGAGLAALTRLRDAGRELRLYVTEGRPFMDGARLASWELRQAGLEHKIIPDAGVAWLFDREPVDAVLVRAEWVAANGDTGALVGARAVAQLAAAVEGEQPRLIVLGPTAVIDPSTPDGAAIPTELRPARDLSTYLADVPVRAADALVPAADVIPGALVAVMVSELGAGWAGEPR